MIAQILGVQIEAIKNSSFRQIMRGDCVIDNEGFRESRIGHRIYKYSRG